MSPFAAGCTMLYLARMLGCPALLVTGSYLGAISHTLTALRALASESVVLLGVIVSESAASVGLAETAAAIRQYTAVPVLELPRLAPGVEPWRQAPELARPLLESRGTRL